MNKDPDVDPVDFASSNELLANETRRLLSALNRAIDHSSVLRDIIRLQERLLALESIAGPSRKSLSLRQEIAQLEKQLNTAPNDNEAASDPSQPAT